MNSWFILARDDKAHRLLEGTDSFDSEWYSATYPDVRLLGMEPLTHYSKYGAAMGRWPNPTFDPEFYWESYRDVQALSEPPIIHFLSDARRRERPTNRSQLERSLAEIKAQGGLLSGGNEPSVVVSYCTPVMDRGDDIRGTLPTNLEANRGLAGAVEFILIFFDTDTVSHEWVRATFAEDIASGLLRVIISDKLDVWHFGRAKNAFGPHLAGRVYSSLDGDNFVTRAESEQLLGIHEKYRDHFIFHHFTGNWGDGSSGRVSVPAPIYRAVGYNPTLLPRQFDEVDMMLSVMRRFPAVPFICLSETKNALAASDLTREFIAESDFGNPVVALHPVERRAPLNPRGAGYSTKDPLLKNMLAFNQSLSFLANATSRDQKQRYATAAVEVRHHLADTIPAEEAVRLLFEPEVFGPREKPRPDEICLFCCLKDEESVIGPFLEHYRRRGVTRFFIVDDHSERPVGELIAAPDVQVFRPKAGNFVAAKGLWLEGLMKAWLEPGAWVLTVDADEFVDVPHPFEDFPALRHEAERRGAEWIAGILIDMLPDPELDSAFLKCSERRFEAAFSHHCDVQGEPTSEYVNEPSVRWAFGPHAALSWRFDSRFHAFGTFDSLRKMPFLRFGHHQHLNQGFHNLHYTCGRKSPTFDIWESRPILPIRHYKLVKLVSDAARSRMVGSAARYHERSERNIREIFGSGCDAISVLRAVPSCKYVVSCLGSDELPKNATPHPREFLTSSRMNN